MKVAKSFSRECDSLISSILIEVDEAGAIVVLKSPTVLNQKEVNLVLSISKKYFQNVSIVVGGNEVGGFGRKILDLSLRENTKLKLRVPAGSFSQVNWSMNQKLIEKVLQVASPIKGKTVLDLYSGAGNFSLPFSLGRC